MELLRTGRAARAVAAQNRQVDKRRTEVAESAQCALITKSIAAGAKSNAPA